MRVKSFAARLGCFVFGHFRRELAAFQRRNLGGGCQEVRGFTGRRRLPIILLNPKSTCFHCGGGPVGHPDPSLPPFIIRPPSLYRIFTGSRTTNDCYLFPSLFFLFLSLPQKQNSFRRNIFYCLRNKGNFSPSGCSDMLPMFAEGPCQIELSPVT